MILFESRWLIIMFDHRSPVQWAQLLVMVYLAVVGVWELLEPGVIWRLHLLPRLDWQHPERWAHQMLYEML